MAQTAKKIVMIIANKDFRDEELKKPKVILEDSGIEVVVASSSLDEAHGMLGYKIKPDILVNDIKIDEYDAVVLVGGLGAKEYWEDTTVHKLVNDTYDKNKVIAAICIAPVTLAKSGILNGKKATVFFTEGGHLKRGGATYTGKAVEVDGNIITGNGPGAATKFGEALVELLK